MGSPEHVLSIEDDFLSDQMRGHCSCGWQGPTRFTGPGASPKGVRVTIVGDHTAHLVEVAKAAEA